MRLTPLAKAFIAAVVFFVIAFSTWYYKGDAIKRWAGGSKASGEDSKGDFDKLNSAPGDPGRNVGSTGVSGVAIGTGRLSRPLVVGINTWAGHAPGIVFNNGMDPNGGSQYKSKYGMDVKFVLLEDPSAKLAAFRNGQVDVMWNTVDNWAREASVLAENRQQAKSIIMQDWSRGGDGIAALSSIKSVEDLKGHKIACTQFTPSHFLLLYLLSQSGLSPQERADVEKNVLFTQDAALAAAAFKAKQVDAAVTWEPDLSGAVAARGSEAHVLVSTQAATNIIADTLIARQDVIDQAPETIRDFVRGWLEGIEMIKNNPNGSYAVVGQALKLDTDTVSGMLSGLKLTPYADNAQFYGLTGPKAHYETLFDTAFVIWRKKGLVSVAVDAKGWADTRFLQAVAANFPGQKVEEAPVVAKAPSDKDVPILHQQIQIQFTPGSDEIMPGSYLLLDKLGETMTSFGSTVLRVEGNTDSTGSATGNLTLSERRALSVKNYIVKNFPNIPPTRFQTIGRGSSNPVAENTTEAGRQQNRRTDIKVILATQ
ncbi:MAG TPA: phosphate ABC transporter substrate-binding/OmpA family protein [Pyrinomonadaceae bacterium]|jgi:NitT/TauT family transport system substrate-binding protein|nr:phosphate ABC transporter substrate-binding/OmpA family protein [Pyrinomonadaceae bacterium]